MADVTWYLWCVLTTEKNTLKANNFVKKRAIENVGIVINGVSKKIVVTGLQLHYQEQSEKKPWYKECLVNYK
jgi:hypothetical protein